MEKLQVLFVDDDINLGELISGALESDYNYSVHFQNTMIGIEHIINELKPDIIILDVEVGTENSIAKAKDIITNHPLIPLLFVSSHTEDNLITEGMGIGGYAYIPKPLSIPVLASYIQRFTSESFKKKHIELANYILNLCTNELLYKKEEIKKLSPFEKTVLELLMKHPNKIVSKEEVINKLWDKPSESASMATIHNVISRLRDIFKMHNLIKINTVRGVGYILECDI